MTIFDQRDLENETGEITASWNKDPKNWLEEHYKAHHSGDRPIIIGQSGDEVDHLQKHAGDRPSKTLPGTIPDALRDEVLAFADAYVRLLQSRMDLEDPLSLRRTDAGDTRLWEKTLDDITAVMGAGHSIDHEQEVSSLALLVVTNCWEYGRSLKHAVAPETYLTDKRGEQRGGRFS